MDAGRTRTLDPSGEGLRSYVTWSSGLQNQGESTVRHTHTRMFAYRLSRPSLPAQVLLHVTHSNLKAHFMELRLDRHMTIER